MLKPPSSVIHIFPKHKIYPSLPKDPWVHPVSASVKRPMIYRSGYGGGILGGTSLDPNMYDLKKQAICPHIFNIEHCEHILKIEHFFLKR